MLDALRELAHGGSAILAARGLVLLGDPDFGASPAGTHGSQKASRQPWVNLRGGCSAYLDSLLRPLPDTRTEIAGIALHCTGQFEWVKSFLGAEASEGNVKRFAPGARVIHLATHGYYLAPDCAELGADLGATLAGVNPLLTSGLLLAGARHALSTSEAPPGDDGVLSALEVAEMDLTGTELVTLSACESGLGADYAAEGMYGLRRAFRLAGAQSVLAALWSLPDQATSEVVQALYGQWTSGVSDAMRAAQLQWLTDQRMAGFPDHPYLWAGLVAFELPRVPTPPDGR